jgi:hypothetical protein
MMKLLACATVVFAFAALVVPLGAGQSAPQPAGAPTTVPAPIVRSSGRSLSVIHGKVQEASGAIVPSAKLHLRNLDTGRIEAVTVADHAGEFWFYAGLADRYVIEALDEAEQVVATSELLATRSGETIGTLLVLPARRLSLPGVFRSTAAGIVAAAATAGITAVTQTVPPASPER